MALLKVGDKVKITEDVAISNEARFNGETGTVAYIAWEDFRDTGVQVMSEVRVKLDKDFVFMREWSNCVIYSLDNFPEERSVETVVMRALEVIQPLSLAEKNAIDDAEEALDSCLGRCMETTLAEWRKQYHLLLEEATLTKLVKDWFQNYIEHGA